MTQNSIVAFPSLPLDIIREIFEHAAHENYADRFLLSLVSRLVQQWTDSLAFRAVFVISNRLAEKTQAMLVLSPKSARLLRVLSYVRTLVIVNYEFHVLWERLASSFPCLVVFYSTASDEDFVGQADPDQPGFEPPSIPTLRRIGGGYGCNILRGWWRCAQMLTHLDLTDMFTRNWDTLEDRGIRFLSSLTHLAFDLDSQESSQGMQEDLQILPPCFPPSLLLCIVNLRHIDDMLEDDSIAIAKFAYSLDNRLLLCTSKNVKFDPEWIMSDANVMDDFLEWSDENTCWVRGLDMVTKRAK
ncbi:hypothetical protein DL96DRAFT_1628536, partial [Flagelloscypha sp. PMI_526]